MTFRVQENNDSIQSTTENEI